MDVKDLRYFVAVYEAEGFSRASRELGTVQSNVSARIRNLEDLLGIALFERRYRRVAPTAGADKLYRHAKKVISSLNDAERAIKRSRVKGFTLLELLVVVVIIGLLAGFVAPRYFGQVGQIGGRHRQGADRRAGEGARPVPARRRPLSERPSSA